MSDQVLKQLKEYKKKNKSQVLFWTSSFAKTFLLYDLEC